MIQVKVISDLVQSQSVQGRRVYRLLLPDRQFEERLPLVTLLHGVHGAETDWMEKGNVRDLFAQLLSDGSISPMAILMVSDGLTGIGTGYLNWQAGLPHRYESYLLEDLIPEVERRYFVGGTREKRSVSGLSMGGYAAIRIGLSKPEFFAAVSSLSGFFHAKELGRLIGSDHYSMILSNDEGLIERASPLLMPLPDKERLPFIYFDCGTEDEYLDMNRSLRERFLNEDIPHEYAEHDGGHTWDYWSQHIREHMLLHHRILYQHS
jgi:putative tributyrin esterase